MRIIKEGSLKEIEYRHTCHECRTVFAATIKDTNTDRDGQYVVCPLCGAFVEFEKYNPITE